MLHYLYPRLDTHVTTGLNHLLKAPFCIHPKTGYVCIPFSPKQVAKFDPMAVPTIKYEIIFVQISKVFLTKHNDHYSMLMKELTKFDEEGETNGESNVREYRKTSMNRSVALFDEFVYKLAKMNSDPMEF
jgi:DNA primase small subunit